jgi:large repetitive protein
LMRIRIVWLFACSWAAAAATPLTITTTQIPDGLAYQPYSFQLQASGGTPPYTWMAPDIRQLGIEFDSATGLLHGTPGPSGIGLNVSVSDSAGQSAQKFFTFHFWGPVQVTASALPTGLVNAPYGMMPFYGAATVKLVSGALPPGIALQPTGSLDGTAAQAGSYSFTLTATGFGGDTLTHTFTLLVIAPLSITINPNFSFAVNQPATIPWLASGGLAPYFAAVTGQPDGMVLAADNMSLVGTPSRAGTFRVIVTMIDQASPRQQAATTVLVLAPLSVGPLTAPARQNNAFSTSLSVTGGMPPYTWKMTGGALPAGLSLSATGLVTGLITGAPGNYTFTVTVTDSRASTVSSPLSLLVAGPAIGAQPLPHAQAGISYMQSLKATGGTPAYAWSVSSGSLPAGLSLDRATGIIGGVPSAAGSYSFLARVADSFGSFAEAPFVIVVDAAQLSLSAQAPATGNAGSPYQVSLSAAGGVAPYRFVLDSGTLPDGLALSESGVLSGTLIRKGTWTFTVRVTDGSQQTARASFTFQVLGPVPTIAPGSLVNAASYLGGLAPGGYISLFGTNLAASSDGAQTLPLPATLGNVMVQWNGAGLPLLAVSPSQINAQVPFAAAQGTAELKVTSDGVTSAAVSVSVQAASPGLFQVSPGMLLAINEDGTLNSSSHPAPVGSVVVMYGTGCGGYDKPLPTGGGVPIDRLYPLALPGALAVGGAAAEMLFAGAAPALGTGLVQINARIPAVAPGEWPVKLTVGGAGSNDPHIFVSDAVK